LRSREVKNVGSDHNEREVVIARNLRTNFCRLGQALL
jgi:hypothetical protein